MMQRLKLRAIRAVIHWYFVDVVWICLFRSICIYYIVQSAQQPWQS